jgi:hypothetical protein
MSVFLPRLRQDIPVVDNKGIPVLSFMTWWDKMARTVENLNTGSGVTSFNTRTGAVTLSSGDVTTALGFTPQPAGSYLTANQTITLSGDASGSGNTAITVTLANVNGNIGTFGNGVQVPTITVNAKGLITAVTPTNIPTFTSVGNGFVPASGGGTTNFLRADGTWAAPTSSYPWTEKSLTSDFTNNTTSANLITDGTNALSFTPPANSNWEAEALLLIQSAATTTGPRIGVSVAAQGTGSYGSCLIEGTGATATTFSATWAGWTTAAGGAAATTTDWPTANIPFLVRVTMRGHSGASPALIQITLASEIASSTVTAKAGSMLRTKNS